MQTPQSDYFAHKCGLRRRPNIADRAVCWDKDPPMESRLSTTTTRTTDAFFLDIRRLVDVPRVIEKFEGPSLRVRKHSLLLAG